MPAFPQQIQRYNGTDWSDDELISNESSTDSVSGQWDGSIYGLEVIGHGSAGIVFALDDQRVVKIYVGSDNRSLQDYETERQAYINLGRGSQHVLKCLELFSREGLVFERCQGTLRSRIKSRRGDYLPQTDALKYAIQAARGLAYVHDCGIIQGDVGCHNMLLDRRGTLKIADFAGSSVRNSRFSASVSYEVGSKLPGRAMPTVKSDIFAFGSAIYEMINCKAPYKGTNYTEIQRRFRMGLFPDDFGPLPILKPIVDKCWGADYRSYTCMDEVYADLCKLEGCATNASEFFKCNFNRRKIQKSCYTETLPRLESTSADSFRGQNSPTKYRRRKEHTYVDIEAEKKRSKEYYKESGRELSRRNHRKKSEGTAFSWLIDSLTSLRIPLKNSSGSPTRNEGL